MQKKLIVGLIIILLATFMVIDFKINSISIFESFFREFETDSIRDLRFGNIAYQGASAEIEVNNREILVTDNEKYLYIDNQMGSVDIVGAECDNITLSYELRVYAETVELAESYLTELEVIDSIDDNRLILELQKLKKPEGVYGIEVNYDILVPKEMFLNIQNKYGQLVVTNMSGNVLLRNSFDKMEVRNIGGQAELFAHYGDVFVKSIEDSLKLESAYHSQVDVSNIEGDLIFKNAYGQARVARVNGDFNLDSSYGTIYFDEIRGDVNLVSKYTDIRGSKINGEFLAVISYGQINLLDINNHLDIDSRYAELELNLSKDLTDYRVYCEIEYGDISSDLPFMVEERDNTRILHGKEGTGELRINLINDHGDIKLYK